MTRTTRHAVDKSLKGLLMGTLLSSLLIAGCSEPTTTSKTKDATDLSVFEGCYTVSHDEPAQIRISEQAGKWVMQMKEPVGAKTVWDEPSALEEIGRGEIPKYFSIDPKHVDALLARPDKVMVMAHVTSAYANIDPLLDSQYLAYIYRGANTIYKVDCDTVNVDMTASPHGTSNIVIDNINAADATAAMPTKSAADPVSNDAQNAPSDTDSAAQTQPQ
ncbi:hypothetical protein [Psychrobacter aestuarii]|uniref:Lipoprotein n=1 Tax=Psychrobacter aestuarii TaxID=556327 RepID=A0ABN0VNH3_9GAMM|nr:hypothetical protein [Psychrobacter aestuarii]